MEGRSLSRRLSRHDASEVDESSNVSHPSVDSTHSDRMVIDESGGLDISSSHDITSSIADRQKSSRSSKDSENSPRSSTDITDSGDRVSQSRTPDTNSAVSSFPHRSRSPRVAGSDLHFSGMDPNSHPHSSSDMPTSTGSNLPTSSAGLSSYSSGQVGSSASCDSGYRNQEPAPLLCGNYDNLSDDD